MKVIKKLSWTNRIILLSLLLILLTNPWSVGYIGLGAERVVIYFTLYANYGFVVGLVALGLVNIYVVYQSRQKTNIPKKNSKTSRAGAYLEA